VHAARRQLEQAGEIAPAPNRRQLPVSKRPSPVRDAIARLGIDATPRQVADADHVSYHSAWRMLRDMRAQAEPCGRCGKLYVPTLRNGGRPHVYCSKRCADAAYKDTLRSRHGPTDRDAAQAEIDRIYRGVSPVPDLSAGYCAKAPPDKQKLWTSGHPADRRAAKHMCLAACPMLRICRAWAVTLPVADYNVYGGWEWSERIGEKSARSGETWRLGFSPVAE
jgi:hypothetical protein